MAETKIKPNQIDVNWNSIEGGKFHPTNTQELEAIFTNNNDGVIDFSVFDGEWNDNGYNLTGKYFTFENLNILGFQTFDWFKKALFTFTDCGMTFVNLQIGLSNIDCENAQNLKGILEFSKDSEYSEVIFKNCNIGIYNLSNVSEFVNIIKITDSRLEIENCNFNFNGNIDVGAIIDITNNSSNECNVKFSNMSVSNFNNAGFCIKFETNQQTYININYSTFFGEQINILLPNNSQVNANYSQLGNTTIIESTETFQTWTSNTTYNENDLLEWTDPGNSNRKIYFRVLQTFTPTDYDYWNALNNQDQGQPDPYIEYYYNTRIDGLLYNVRNDDNKIQEYGYDGNIRLFGVQLASEDYHFPINDSNLQAHSVRDAIIELADRVNTLEQR